MSYSYDVVVIGSGFAGSLLAMIARRLGRSVLMLEKGRHPRVTIGESSTPLANLILEELATRYDLPRVAPFAKYGTWRRSYPEVACGLKRGFTFLHHDLEGAPNAIDDRDRQLLVAASPNDEISDTHWYRADFDAILVDEARSIGVEYLDEVKLERARETADGVQLEGRRRGQLRTFDARFVVDATGPRGFLHHAFGLREAALPNFPKTQALYSHFRGVGRLGDPNGDTPPYPMDDAAVHHVFDGGWIWVLQFNNGITSAGVAATDEAFARLRLAEGAPAWERLVTGIPLLRRQFAEATPTLPFTHIPRLSFRSGSIAGERWALLPSAAGFVDPLLSTGFPLVLLGVARVAEMIATDWGSSDFGARLRTYSEQTDGELLAASRLIGGLYANMGNFPVFAALTLLYFAAASYSETVRRLGKPHLATSFLLHDDPSFGPPCVELLRRARHIETPFETNGLIQDIHRAIEPFDLAGLTCVGRRNWYPVDPEDVFRAAWKVDENDKHIVGVS